MVDDHDAGALVVQLADGDRRVRDHALVRVLERSDADAVLALALDRMTNAPARAFVPVVARRAPCA